jgi:hypothetical protein
MLVVLSSQLRAPGRLPACGDTAAISAWDMCFGPRAENAARPGAQAYDIMLQAPGLGNHVHNAGPSIDSYTMPGAYQRELAWAPCPKVAPVGDCTTSARFCMMPEIIVPLHGITACHLLAGCSSACFCRTRSRALHMLLCWLLP